jgi:hypothetical protein
MTKFVRLILLVALTAASGCAYQGAFDLSCTQDGAIEDGRTCENGYWVATPDEPSSDPPNFDQPECTDCAMPDLTMPPVVGTPPVLAENEGPLRITFEHAAGVDIEDFVALVDVEVVGLVRDEGSEADDVRFEAEDGSVLDHEIERYTPLAGRLTAWVKVPVLRADGSTYVVMHYGGSAADPPNDLWDGYEMVFHLDSETDSAGGDDATNHGSEEAVGMIGSGRSFDGVEQYIDTDNKTDLDSWSVSLWVRAADVPMTSEGPNGPLMREGNYQVLWDHDDDQMIGTATVKTGRDVFDASFGMMDGGQWYHLAATFDGEDLRSYRDGKLITTNDMPNGKAAHTKEAAVIGRTAKKSDEPFAFFAGIVDEVRVYDGVRSDAWYDASYRNQSDPASFYVVTPEAP